jgi:hypothetical protein
MILSFNSVTSQSLNVSFCLRLSLNLRVDEKWKKEMVWHTQEMDIEEGENERN